MPSRSLRIAWLGPAPGEDGGVLGVTTELLGGLSRLGHRVDCFFPSSGQRIPARLADDDNLSFNWGTSEWHWDRWYSRTRITAFGSGMVSRGLASVRLRRQIVRRHREQPYDLIYQFSSIEGPAVPTRLTRTVPLVIHPETHAAGELRALISERRLILPLQPVHRYVTVAGIMLLRSLVQRVRVRRARLLVCISSVFRDHLVHDYRFPRENTVVVPNPVRVERFAADMAGERWEDDVVMRIGVFDGITLVVDGIHFSGDTWFDRAGNYHSPEMHVVERYTLRDPDHLQYEATIEDPKVFSRPWKMQMILYRHIEQNFQLLEYDCIAFPDEAAGNLAPPTPSPR